MTRFHSEGEVKKFDQKLKELNKEELIDISHLKDSLKNDIIKDYHRINVDSAKKKAVIQRMDYDGFHQMVLGADLKGMRPEEIIYLDHKRDEKVLNSTSTKDRLTKEVNVLENLFVEDGCDKNVYKFKNCTEDDILIDEKLKKLTTAENDKKLKESIYEVKVLINSMDHKNEIDKLRLIEIFHYIKSSISLDTFFKNIGFFEIKTYSIVFFIIKSSLEIIIELEESINIKSSEQKSNNNINENEIEKISNLKTNEKQDIDLNINEINQQIDYLIELINSISLAIIKNIDNKELSKASMFISKKVKEELSSLILIVEKSRKNSLIVQDLSLFYK